MAADGARESYRPKGDSDLTGPPIKQVAFRINPLVGAQIDTVAVIICNPIPVRQLRRPQRLNFLTRSNIRNTAGSRKLLDVVCNRFIQMIGGTGLGLW